MFEDRPYPTDFIKAVFEFPLKAGHFCCSPLSELASGGGRGLASLPCVCCVGAFSASVSRSSTPTISCCLAAVNLLLR